MEDFVDEGAPLQAVARQRTAAERAARRELEAKYRAFSCNECGEIHGYETDAEQCCPPGLVFVCPTCSSVHFDVIDAQTCEKGHVGEAGNDEVCCPRCGDVAADYIDAVNCCLWFYLDFSQRLILADHYRYRRFDLAAAMLPH